MLIERQITRESWDYYNLGKKRLVNRPVYCGMITVGTVERVEMNRPGGSFVARIEMRINDQDLSFCSNRVVHVMWDPPSMAILHTCVPVQTPLPQPEPMMSKMNPAHPIHQNAPLPTIVYRAIPFNGPASYTSPVTDPRDRYVVWSVTLPHHRIVVLDLVHGIKVIEELCGYHLGTRVVDQRSNPNCCKAHNLELRYRRLPNNSFEVWLPGDGVAQIMTVPSLGDERLNDWTAAGAILVKDGAQKASDKLFDPERYNQEYSGTFPPPEPVIIWDRYRPGNSLVPLYRVWCPDHSVRGEEMGVLLEDAVKKLKARLGLTGKKVPIVAATQWKAINAPKTAGIDPLAPAKPVMHFWRVCDAEGSTLYYEFWAPVNVGKRELYVRAQKMNDHLLQQFNGCEFVDKGLLILRGTMYPVPAHSEVENTIYLRELRHTDDGTICHQAWSDPVVSYVEVKDVDAIKKVFETRPFNHARLVKLPRVDWPAGEMAPKPPKSKLVKGVDLAAGESFTVKSKITYHPNGEVAYTDGIVPAPNQNTIPASGSAFQVSQWNNPIPMASGVNPGWAPTPNTPAQAKYIVVERQTPRKRKDCDEWVGPWAARPEGRMMPCQDGETPEEAVENLKMTHPWLENLSYIVAPSTDEDDALRAAAYGQSNPHPIPVKHKTARPARASRSLDL